MSRSKKIVLTEVQKVDLMAFEQTVNEAIGQLEQLQKMREDQNLKSGALPQAEKDFMATMLEVRVNGKKIKLIPVDTEKLVKRLIQAESALKTKRFSNPMYEPGLEKPAGYSVPSDSFVNRASATSRVIFN
jgi:hypothetical protein